MRRAGRRWTPGIARPIGRAWIETSLPADWPRPWYASPGQLAGRGLKLCIQGTRRTYQPASPGQLAGRGLKLVRGKRRGRSGSRIARPIGRAWIETSNPRSLSCRCQASPSQLAGRGLKHGLDQIDGAGVAGIARPIGRAWIETSVRSHASATRRLHRPANWPGVD